MSSSFYGNFLREKFPLKSKVRMEDDSSGAKLLNSIGSEIENTYRRKVFSNNTSVYISSDKPINSLGTLYRLDLLDNNNYKENILNETVKDVVDDSDITGIKSLEELYNSLPTKFNLELEKTISNKNPLILALTNERFENTTYSLSEESFIYINVKKVLQSEDKKANSFCSVSIRGKDINMNPLEETIHVYSEKLYKTKNKFITLERLAQNTKHNISGGPCISISNIKVFEIDVLCEPCKTWLENQNDYQELDENLDYYTTAKVKRIEVESFVSKPKFNELVLSDMLGDNSLTVELVNVNGKSKLRYIHRYFNDVLAYRNEYNYKVSSDHLVIDHKDLEDKIFEKFIGETYLYNQSNEIIDAIDFDYNLSDGLVYVLSSDGSLYSYEIGVATPKTNKIFRTYNPGIRIDSLVEYIGSDETHTIRLINTSLDLPLNNFLIGKLEDDSLTFLNESKTSFEEEIVLFSPIGDAIDKQDSLELFSFDLNTNETDIELFVICLNNNSKNSSAISSYNNAITKPSINELMRSLSTDQINTKLLTYKKILPKSEYPQVLSPNFTPKYLYIKGSDRSIWIVDQSNNHYKYIPEYDTFIYMNNAIYRTKDKANVTYTFTLTNGIEYQV